MGVCNVSIIISVENPCKIFSNNLNKTMALPILKMTQTKCYLPYLSCLEKTDWWKTEIFIEPSNQMTRFLQASPTWNFAFLKMHFLIILFCKTEQRYFDLNVKNRFLKNLRLISLTWTLILVYFLDIVPDIVHRMIKWGLKRLSNDV